jgi:hypothetical protein
VKKWSKLKLNKTTQLTKIDDMKSNKVLMCALAAGLMAFSADKAQASSKLVIGGSLYVPISIKGTFSYDAGAGKIKQKTTTSKEVISKLGYAKGTMLAIGPSSDVYAIKDGVVLANLTTLGYFSFSTSGTVDTTTGALPAKGIESEAGVVTLDFASGVAALNPDLVDLIDNDVAFNVTGTYTLKDTHSAVVSGLYKDSIKFSSKNLGGLSWITAVGQTMPVSGSMSGSGSGSGVVAL